MIDGLSETFESTEIASYAVLNAVLKYDKKTTITILKDGADNDYINNSFSTSRLDGNNNLEVYLMQGTGKISNSADLINLYSEQKIESAAITSTNEIIVKLSAPVKLDDSDGDSKLLGFQISDDTELLSVSAEKDTESAFSEIIDGYADCFILTASKEIDLSKKLTLTKEGLGGEPTMISVSPLLFNSKGFESTFTYDGNDLGTSYSKGKTIFKVWAPTASDVSLVLYSKGEPESNEKPMSTTKMVLGDKGVWSVEIVGDCKNLYYVYDVVVNGISRTAVDPYAKAVGVNGLRGMVADLQSTDPEGFRTHFVPEFENPTDAIIYEIHVRDLSMNENSGITNKGKFLGFTETGTTNTAGLATGIDHMKELGVTHVHLLPSFDYKTIDETKLDENNFNWGYDPQNYNVPEGSYSTDPYNGGVRINEFKQMVQALHENGLRVVMDVVYNHTYTAEGSNFEAIVPDYYYRKDLSGKYTNGSGCGNETASERAMMRKLIVDSVVYWATEYRVDGFRFDLMALHDIETMNLVREALNEIDPSIIVYGEGWTGGTSPLSDSQKALKTNMSKLDPNIAAFSDNIRDGIKGSVFNESETGFVNSGSKTTSNRDESIKFGIVGSVKHPQINASDFWAKEPTQTITYVSAHDNLTLWDKLKITNKMATEEELVQLNKLAAAIVLTSQGIPFFQAGEEMARTKNGNDNSYQSPDRINMLNWDSKTEHKDLVDYYRGLISLRKKYDAFRLTTADEIRDSINFADTEFSVVAYTLKNSTGDYPQLAVVFNGTTEEKQVTLEANTWDILVNGQKAGTDVLDTIKGGVITVLAKTALVLGENTTISIEETKEAETPEASSEPSSKPEQAPKATETPNDSESNNGNNMLIPIIAGAVALVAACAGGIFIWMKRKK